MSVRDPDPIPLETPDPPPPPGRPCPSCGRRLEPGGIHCSSCGFNLVRGWGPEPGVSSSSDPVVCQKCGYDLFGNISGICPECGTRRKHGGPATPGKAAPGPIPCRNCGYDLVGNISGICPECGHLAPANTVGRAALFMPTAAEAMRTAYIRVAICAAVAALALPIAYHTAGDLARAIIGTVVAAPLGLILYFLVSMVWDGFDTPWRLAAAQVLAVTALLVAAAGLLHLTSASPVFAGISYRAVSIRGILYTIVAIAAVCTVIEDDVEDAWVAALPLGFVAAIAVPATYWVVP